MLDSDELYKRIGERIRDLRELQQPKMSQEELAEVLELKRTSVTNIERGNQKITLDSLYALCARFGLEIQAVLPPVQDVTGVEPKKVVVGGQMHEVGAKLLSSLQRQRLKPPQSKIR